MRLPLALAVVLAPSLGLAQEAFDGRRGSDLGIGGGGGFHVPRVEGREVTHSGFAPAAGHNLPAHHGSQYDIWKLNCHTQANVFAAQAAMSGLPAGVLACRGNPESSPQFHTANWAVQPGGQTCIMNWGWPSRH